MIAQEKVTFKEGQFFEGENRITVNEFRVLLEHQGLMTSFNKNRMDRAQDRILSASTMRLTNQIVAGISYATGLYWLSQGWTFREGPNEAIGGGTFFLILSFVDPKKRSYKIYAKVVEEYNQSLGENTESK